MRLNEYRYREPLIRIQVRRCAGGVYPRFCNSVPVSAGEFRHIQTRFSLTPAPSGQVCLHARGVRKSRPMRIKRSTPPSEAHLSNFIISSTSLSASTSISWYCSMALAGKIERSVFSCPAGKSLIDDMRATAVNLECGWWVPVGRCTPPRLARAVDGRRLALPPRGSLVTES